ncbi:MAG: CBS domain-containing protein [Candidatus Margulisiibacteriota bacterium]
MVLFSEMFASELIGVMVVDRVQENLGKVKDIMISLNEAFPKVSGILITTINDNKKEDKVLLISEIDLVGKQFVSTRTTADQIVWTTLRDGEVLLMRDLIDHQVVDVEGARIIRINDLKLAKVDQDVRLLAADVGSRGMLRRLGLEKIVDFITGLVRKKIPEQLIGWDNVQGLEGGTIAVPSKTISDLHPSDVAQIISQVRAEDRNALFSSLSDKTAAESLHELEPVLGAILISTLETRKALRILEKMPVDEAADILGDLPQDKSLEYLRLMPVRKSEQIRKLLAHKDETAGGLMTSEFITLPKELTVEEVIKKLREMPPDAETIYYLYVVDEKEQLVGVLSLRSLIVSSPEMLISKIMKKDCITISPEMNQREVAAVISKYNLLAVPVVDDENKILGIITVDDVMDFVLPPISRRKKQMLG